jgi:Cu+-exporting ATPase
MHASEVTTDTDLVRDPVCGMGVDPSSDKPSHTHGGHTYHFCSEGCRKKFVAAPESYITATDPVCGMSVDRASAKHLASHGGARFYFCSAGVPFGPGSILLRTCRVPGRQILGRCGSGGTPACPSSP